MNDNYRSFYDERRQENYAHDYASIRPDQHRIYKALKSFISDHNLDRLRCLEIGSSGGMFQDMVPDYHGTDIAHSLAKHYRKPYSVAEGTRYPFPDASFDAIWTIAVFEHIPHLQEAMSEIKRLLKPGGVILFAPAWQCRSWAADGYEVRPYSDFGLYGRIVKASIPIRDSLLWRGAMTLPKRIIRHLAFIAGLKPKFLRYKKIKPNYEKFWVSDADACNHIDPHDAVLWFESNGFTCLSHPLHLKALLIRNSHLILRKK